VPVCAKKTSVALMNDKHLFNMLNF